MAKKGKRNRARFGRAGGRAFKRKPKEKTSEPPQTFICIYCGDKFAEIKVNSFLKHVKGHSGGEAIISTGPSSQPIADAQSSCPSHNSGGQSPGVSGVPVSQSTEEAQMPHPDTTCFEWSRESANALCKTDVISNFISTQSEGTASKERPYACPTCGKRFKKRAGLTKHSWLHVMGMAQRKLKQRKETTVKVVKKRNQCPICGLDCESRRGLSKHIQTHDDTAEGKVFTCSYCDKKYTRPDNLRVHTRIHTGEKPFLCSYCGRSFGHNCSLKGHLLTHVKERAAEERGNAKADDAGVDANGNPVNGGNTRDGNRDHEGNILTNEDHAHGDQRSVRMQVSPYNRLVNRDQTLTDEISGRRDEENDNAHTDEGRVQSNEDHHGQLDTNNSHPDARVAQTDRNNAQKDENVAQGNPNSAQIDLDEDADYMGEDAAHPHSGSTRSHSGSTRSHSGSTRSHSDSARSGSGSASARSRSGLAYSDIGGAASDSGSARSETDSIHSDNDSARSDTNSTHTGENGAISHRVRTVLPRTRTDVTRILALCPQTPIFHPHMISTMGAWADRAHIEDNAAHTHTSFTRTDLLLTPTQTLLAQTLDGQISNRPGR